MLVVLKEINLVKILLKEVTPAHDPQESGIPEQGEYPAGYAAGDRIVYFRLLVKAGFL